MVSFGWNFFFFGFFVERCFLLKAEEEGEFRVVVEEERKFRGRKVVYIERLHQ